MAANVLVKFDGVDGESVQDAYVGWIECSSYSEGQTAEVQVGGTGMGGGKTVIHPFSIQAEMGAHSCELKSKMHQGTHFATAELHIMKNVSANTMAPFYIIKCKNVYIDSHSTSGAGGTNPFESITFHATEVTYEYFKQATEGGDLTSTGAKTYNQKEAKAS
jgi:type VI protein secretion system component Hcp